MKDYNAFGQAVRRARMDRMISQERLAELANVTPTHIKHVESGHRKPSFELLAQLTELLCLDLNQIFSDTTAKENEPEALIRVRHLLEQCDEKQLKIVIALLKAMLFEN